MEGDYGVVLTNPRKAIHSSRSMEHGMEALKRGNLLHKSDREKAAGRGTTRGGRGLSIPCVPYKVVVLSLSKSAEGKTQFRRSPFSVPLLNGDWRWRPLRSIVLFFVHLKFRQTCRT